MNHWRRKWALFDEKKRKTAKIAIELLTDVIFGSFLPKYLAGFRNGYTFASLLRLTICQIAWAIFLTPFREGVGGRESLVLWNVCNEENWQCRDKEKETTESTSRFRRQVKIQRHSSKSCRQRCRAGTRDESPLRFHLNSWKRRNDNTTTKSLILAQDER